MPIALQDAYDIIHRAILQLGPKREISDPVSCTGEASIEAARFALEQIQTGLVRQIDSFDPETTAPYIPQTTGHVGVRLMYVPISEDDFDQILHLTKQLGETGPEMVASRIISTWVKDNPLD